MGEKSDFNQIEHVFVNIYCYSCPHYDCLQVNKSNNSSKDDQHHLNIIVKNLPYDKREENDNSILFSKVAGLMTDGLKFTNIGIKNVIRKTNRSDSKPGIVVISFENLVQKKSVLKEKRLLKNSSKCSNVFIENDLPLQQRIVNNNNRILLKALGKENDYIECPSNSPFLKNNGAQAPKGPRPIVFKEWRDTRTFSNLKSTHCTLLI